MAKTTSRPPNPAARGIAYGLVAALGVAVVGTFVMHEGGPGLAGFGRALRGGAVVAFGVPVSGLVGFAIGVLHGRRRLTAWRADQPASR